MACVHSNLITVSERHTGSASQEVKLHCIYILKKRGGQFCCLSQRRCCCNTHANIDAAQTACQTRRRRKRNKRRRERGFTRGGALRRGRRSHNPRIAKIIYFALGNLENTTACYLKTGKLKNQLLRQNMSHHHCQLPDAIPTAEMQTHAKARGLLSASSEKLRCTAASSPPVQ